MNIPLFSSRETVQFGSFHYPLGMVEFALSDVAQKTLQRIGAGERITAKEGSKESLTQIAYEICSFLHEMRHFADMFGTIAGCSLFAGYIYQLKHFLAVSQVLRDSGSSWKLPLAEWRTHADCPQAVRDFSRTAYTFNIGADLFICPFKPVEIDGHREELVIEVNYDRGGETDAYPLRVVRMRQEGERLRTILVPLGLEALTEANAHALSRNLVDHYFPADVSEELQHRYQVIELTEPNSTDDQLFAKRATPYMVVDLMITRFLRTRGVSTFPRDLIFTLVDRVLSMASIQVMEVQQATTAVSIDRTGRLLVELLESEDPALLGRGSISDAPEIIQRYEAFLAGLKRGGDWQSVKDDGSPWSSVAIWEAYIAHSVMIPLLRERLLSKGRVFGSHNDFMGLITKLGLPPARVANGKLLLSIMPQRVQQAWWHQLMLGQILNQMLRGGPLFCPRAFHTLPGIATMNLAFHGTCEANIRLGCGTFRAGSKAAITTNCLFEDVLRVCGLKRI